MAESANEDKWKQSIADAKKKAKKSPEGAEEDEGTIQQVYGSRQRQEYDENQDSPPEGGPRPKEE